MFGLIICVHNGNDVCVSQGAMYQNHNYKKTFDLIID